MPRRRRLFVPKRFRYRRRYRVYNRRRQYRRLYRSFRRYKSLKRRGILAAQRRYQKTRYRVNNLITPDELIVSFKRNGLQVFDDPNTQNIQYSVFGCLRDEWTAFSNIQEVAKQFKMVEFLSESTTLYFFNNLKRYRIVSIDTSRVSVQSPMTIFVCYQTARRWLPEITPSGVQQEILFPDITDKQSAWEATSELPGVSGKFISNAGGAKPIQKLRWKFSQKSWKTLKADPTGFQCNLDVDGNLSDTGQPYFPLNNAVVKVAFDFGGAISVMGELEMYGSQRIVLRFKGRRQ